MSVVYIKSGLGRYRFDTPKEAAVLDQKGCMYVPRVLAVMVNQPVAFKNTDPTTHNIHPMPRANHAWNRSLDAGEQPYVTTFSHPELAIPVACNIHPWMRAFLFVFAHPYFAVTPRTGDFELKNVPPGTYTVEAWQERFGTQDATVTIGPNESKSITFTFKSAESLTEVFRACRSSVRTLLTLNRRRCLVRLLAAGIHFRTRQTTWRQEEKSYGRSNAAKTLGRWQRVWQSPATSRL